MRGLWLRLLRLLGWSRSEREIDEELRFHVEMETEALTKSGMDPREARRQALRRFGGEDRYREETRSARGTGWLEDALLDVRFAFRGLRRSPGFALAVLGTLSLGVGATTAIYSVVRGVVLAPLPYPEPDELVTVWLRNPSQGIEEDITSWPNFADWRAGSSTVESMVAVRPRRWALTGEGAAEEVLGASVSRGFFEMLGAPLQLGRPFQDSEVEGDLVRVVVLSHELWTRRFAADPRVVGRTIQLDAEAWEVVGVTAPGQRYPRDAELWTPLAFGDLPEGLQEARGALWLPVIGRLADGVAIEAAQSELDGIAARLREEYPGPNEGMGIGLEPLHETLIGDVRAPLLVLLAAVGLVLLIVVVNVASLLLARGTARTRELGLRLTLGAGRGRVVRQLLAESLVLGAVGGVVGALFAVLAVDVLVRLAPTDLPRIDQVGVDAGLLLFALATAVGAGLLFGVGPALHAARMDVGAQLADGSRGSSGRGLARVRGAFVTGQFALALVLLVGAGLLMRSFAELRAVEPGFRPEGVLSATLALPATRYPNPEAIRGFVDELTTQLAAVPGVERAGTVSTLFLSALPNMGGIAVEGRPELAEVTTEFPVVQDVASEGFFEAAGMRLVAGRAFGPADGVDAATVAVVNETFARVYLQGADPLGARFEWGSGGDDADWITVVGVVADARRSGLDAPVRPSAFLPARQVAGRRMEVLLRTTGDPVALAPALRSVVASIDPELPVARVRTLDQAMADALSARRFVMFLLAAFAATALALAAVGIYGVMAYLVGQRTREIGIRVALGAARTRVLGRVLGEGLAHVVIGLVIGSIASLALAGFLRSQLFGLEPTDPVTFAAATGMLVAVAAVACAVPARRAARLDPMVALREE